MAASHYSPGHAEESDVSRRWGRVGCVIRTTTSAAAITTNNNNHQ
ncbi:hypothetical protein E2C01_092380 [Portunus trituberculatus]|uniref:Uncharacterized protein n=1 Tax=Portunus trituberculatus TaxID=210409 RepID=A0A5B7JVB0_PORTR|nr:hypothetical protein [Portunus trituberculatus]